MKKIVSLTILCIAVFIPTNGAMAQRQVVRATIPFDFMAGNKALPAGAYEFGPPFGGAIRILSAANGRIAARTDTVPEADGPTGVCKVIFVRYGSQYFMRQIRCSAAVMNVSLIPSRQERQFHKEFAAVRNPNQIVVAINQ
jgi:hypothetical protein